LDAVRTDEGVYRAMLHDIYQNGQVLQHRKYRFLGYAYRLFIAGLVITLVAFAIEFALSYA
ncbi:MAG TPA: Pycsar system effector family protein, partial [Croceibacterium sp.]|nr:Pycsar system effector family protein [Croceibacterium sp.]